MLLSAGYAMARKATPPSRKIADLLERGMPKFDRSNVAQKPFSAQSKNPVLSLNGPNEQHNEQQKPTTR